MYSPSKNALYGELDRSFFVAHLYQHAFFFLNSNFMLNFPDSQLKDNPAFSMLNDSDDEVIYG